MGSLVSIENTKFQPFVVFVFTAMLYLQLPWLKLFDHTHFHKTENNECSLTRLAMSNFMPVFKLLLVVNIGPIILVIM